MHIRSLLAAILSLCVAGALPAAAASAPPNVVVMLVDDLGWGDVSCLNDSAVKTPNIDRIAEAGVKFISGDDRFHHNLIVERGDLSAYDNATWPVWMDGNVFLQGAKPSKHEVEPTVRPEYDPELKCAAQGEGCYLTIRMDGDWAARRPRRLITTELLGRARIPDQPFVHPDGSPLALDRDYFGQRRDESHPAPGPFEHRASGFVTFKVW